MHYFAKNWISCKNWKNCKDFTGISKQQSLWMNCTLYFKSK